MVSPSDAMLGLGLALNRSDKIPDEMSYLLHEADLQNDDANVDLPMIEITPVDVDHVHPSNSDFVDFTTNDEGSQTGRVYHTEYQMEVEIDIWTASDGGYDVDELGDALREALYPHSSFGPQEPFLDEDGKEMQIFRFSIESGERQDDIIQTPTVRRWRQEVEIWAFDEFQTTHDPVDGVSPPSSGDL